MGVAREDGHEARRARWRPLFGIVLVIFCLAPAAGAQDDGGDLYLSECGGCHGPQGEGTEWAPSLVDEGAAGADLMMRTGRMPLLRPDDPVERGPQRLTDEQIAAITRRVGELGGPPVPEVHPERGDIGTGAELYLINCAACHGSTGVGAALPDGVNAPSVLRASPLDVAEAVRSGPLAMPSYGHGAIDQHELDSLARYVSVLAEGHDRGGWSLGRWGPVAEGAVAWLVGIAAVIGVAGWIERTTRDHEELEEER